MGREFDKTLVVVPARGGSKRIPKKNTKIINGQPMMYWPLMELSNFFSSKNILVSTDSDEIKKLAESKGLIVPFRRPAKLSDDHTSISEVVTHSLKWFEEHNYTVDYVLTIYPTAVLLSNEDIFDAMNLLKLDVNADSILSAATYPHPIQRAIFKNDKGYAELFEPSNHPKRSQDLVEAMHHAGHFNLSKSKSVRNGDRLINSNVLTKIIKRSKVIDIDTLEDFELADEKLRLYKKKYLKNWRFNL